MGNLPMSIHGGLYIDGPRGPVCRACMDVPNSLAWGDINFSVNYDGPVRAIGSCVQSFIEDSEKNMVFNFICVLSKFVLMDNLAIKFNSVIGKVKL